MLNADSNQRSYEIWRYYMYNKHRRTLVSTKISIECRAQWQLLAPHHHINDHQSWFLPPILWHISLLYIRQAWTHFCFYQNNNQMSRSVKILIAQNLCSTTTLFNSTWINEAVAKLTICMRIDPFLRYFGGARSEHQQWHIARSIFGKFTAILVNAHTNHIHFHW